ncbi:MAG TPA: PH domain-containing protein [Vicinamibacterales bacterium]
MSTDWNAVLLWVLLSALVIAAALTFWVVRRNRRLPGEHVFRASRWSRGNHVFPTQVSISPTDVVQYQPHWFGAREHTIHMAHVASVDIDTKLFLSNVVIETTGGSDPVRCHGHHKADAVEMKRLINQFQSDYFKGPVRPS